MKIYTQSCSSTHFECLRTCFLHIQYTSRIGNITDARTIETYEQKKKKKKETQKSRVLFQFSLSV